MSDARRSVSVGRVGKAHGRDGSFYVEAASHAFPEGLELTIGGRGARIERRGGTDERPLIRLSGMEEREAAAALRGEPLLVDLDDVGLESDEWLVEDLVGCDVAGIGTVTRVLDGPSCDVLEVGIDGVLIPFVSDAVKEIDLAGRRIEVDRRFLGLEERREPA